MILYSDAEGTDESDKLRQIEFSSKPFCYFHVFTPLQNLFLLTALTTKRAEMNESTRIFSLAIFAAVYSSYILLTRQ